MGSPRPPTDRALDRIRAFRISPGFRTVLRVGEWILWGVVVVLAAERLGPQFAAWTGIGPGPEIGRPEWSTRTLDGAVIGREDREQRVSAVVFWATWCRVCPREMRILEEIHRQGIAGARVRVVGLSIDTAGDDAIRRHLQEHGFSFPVARADPELRGAFGGITAVPTVFLIDAEGVVQSRIVGASVPGLLRGAVERLASSAGEVSP